MPFTEEILNAMKALKNACNKNENWQACWRCPFMQCCETLERDGFNIPGDWNETMTNLYEEEEEE